MGNETSIEWTASKDGKPGATWNPWWGCNEIAPECGTHGGGSGLCYAAAFASRGLHPAHRGNAVGGQWTGAVTPSNEAVWKAPFKLAAGTSVFTCSMSDFWHEDVPLPWLERALAVIGDTPQLRYLILTKRPGNINRKLDALKRRWPANAWCGASVGHTKSLPLLKVLRRVDAPLRFLSCEPLMTSLVPGLDLDGIGWVIAGGQSGADARPSHPDWFRQLWCLCQVAGVPFFFKQWGEWLPGQNDIYPNWDGRSVAHHQDGTWGPFDQFSPTPRNYVTWRPDGTPHFGSLLGAGDHFQPVAWATRVGKKAAGAMLDGVLHRGMPV